MQNVIIQLVLCYSCNVSFIFLSLFIENCFFFMERRHMEGKQLAITSHFFKVMMPGYHEKLNLPPAISKEVENQKSRTATLRSRLGTWEVGMCLNCENNLICFSQGWPQFVDRHALSIGDIVVFEPTAQLHLNVVVFDSSACERKFGICVSPNKEKQDKIESTSSMETETPYFEKTMVPAHATKRPLVNIPLEFMRSNNLGHQTSAILRDPKGRQWEVKFSSSLNHGIHLRLYGGWSDFYASNALKDGDVCVFRLQRRLLTHTTIFFDVNIIPTARS